MAYTLVSSGTFASTNQNGFTSATFDSSGGDLLVVVAGSVFSPTSITDNKSNTFTKVGEVDRSGTVSISYCQGGTFGTGHTLTLSGSGNYPDCIYYVFSGSASSPLDGTATTNNNFTVPLNPGSITPSATGELFITGFGGNSGGTYSVGSGFTIFGTQYLPGPNSWQLGAAYKIKTDALAENPAWTSTVAGNSAADLVAFKVAPPPDLNVPVTPSAAYRTKAMIVIA